MDIIPTGDNEDVIAHSKFLFVIPGAKDEGTVNIDDRQLHYQLIADISIITNAEIELDKDDNKLIISNNEPVHSFNHVLADWELEDESGAALPKCEEETLSRHFTEKFDIDDDIVLSKLSEKEKIDVEPTFTSSLSLDN